MHLCTYAPTYALMHRRFGLHMSFLDFGVSVEMYVFQRRRRETFLRNFKVHKPQCKHQNQGAGSTALCELSPKTPPSTPFGATHHGTVHFQDILNPHSPSALVFTTPDYVKIWYFWNFIMLANAKMKPNPIWRVAGSNAPCELRRFMLLLTPVDATHVSATSATYFAKQE